MPGCDSVENPKFDEPWWPEISLESLFDRKLYDSEKMCHRRSASDYHLITNADGSVSCNATFTGNATDSCHDGYVYQFSTFPRSVSADVSDQKV